MAAVIPALSHWGHYCPLSTQAGLTVSRIKQSECFTFQGKQVENFGA